MPEIAIPMKDAAGDWHSAAGTASVLGLLAVRCVPKFFYVAALGLCLQLAAGAAMIFVIMRLLQEKQASSSATLMEGAAR